MTSKDTIAALATAPGRAGVAVLRVSGPGVRSICEALKVDAPAQPRRALHTRWHEADGAVIDIGLSLFFPGPHSFTGEDVLELHSHGGQQVPDLLLQRLLQLGARRARPGEFSERAYLNDKLDLAQAEAISDLIDAGSRAAARAALRSLQGEFSAQVQRLTRALIDLRVYVEAAIDFPEEEIDFLGSAELQQRLADVQAQLQRVETSAAQGVLLTQGMHVVLAGRPNAGKSSLLNRLAGFEAAIVTPIAGTTRDLLRERIDIDGLPLHLVDTAGLRADSADAIEAEGMRRARHELKRADRVLFVIDSIADPDAQAYFQERDSLPPGVPVTLLFNKCDAGAPAPDALANMAAQGVEVLRLSANTGSGVDTLRAHLKRVMGYVEGEGGTVSARARHREALARARAGFDRAAALLQSRQGELVAEELRLAQEALGEITGEFDNEALLGEIFGSFCIGK
ncbi:MAG: hypothetical protein RL026_1428 [Pseudomonadota bacterium]